MKWQLSIVMILILFGNMFYCLHLENEKKHKNLENAERGYYYRSTTANEDGSGSVFYLDRHYIACPNGRVLSAFHLNRKDGNKIFYEYNCRNAKGAVSQKTFVDKQTPFNDTDSNEKSSANFLDRHDVKCDRGHALVSFGLIRQGNKIAYKYRCAKVMRDKSVSCVDKFTDKQTGGARESFYLDRHEVKTDKGYYIRGFKLNSSYENNDTSKQVSYQYRYRVCKLLDVEAEIKKHEEYLTKYKNELNVNIPKKLQDAEKELSSLKTESAKLNDELKKLNADIETLGKKIKEKRAKRKEKRDKVGDLNKKLNEYESKISVVTKSKEDLEKQKADYDAKLKAEEKILNELKNF
jgi:hypothetical protein